MNQTTSGYTASSSNNINDKVGDNTIRGNSTDLWGRESWLWNDFSDTNFGVNISCTSFSVYGAIDFMQVRIHYDDTLPEILMSDLIFPLTLLFVGVLITVKFKMNKFA